ncbi:MAG: hypothetical protein O2913_08430 [Chloroflexi bacterium]|nr:hypothetical protein [Chloroflexota bacterium]
MSPSTNNQPGNDADSDNTPSVERFAPVTGLSNRKKASVSTKIYLVEDQPLLMETYQGLFNGHPGYEIAGSATSLNDEALLVDIPVLNPDVLLCGVKVLGPDTVESLREIQETSPGTPFMVMAGSYEARGIRDLREFAAEIQHGWACVTKQSIHSLDAFAPILESIDDGRVTFDATTFRELMDSDDEAADFLQRLSPEEVEAAGWIAQGYDNNAIGGLLNLELSAVERLVGGVYEKLPAGPEQVHPRVLTATLYLEAAGYLRT